MQAKSQQLLLVAGASALTIALYFAPQKVTRETPALSETAVGFESRREAAKSGLQRQEAELISSLENQLQKETGNLSLMDSLGRRWDALQKPALAAHYFDEHAKKDDEEKS